MHARNAKPPCALYDNTAARGPGMLYLHGSPSEGKTIADLETALRAEITRVQREGVSIPPN